jgi:EAL domain-containing protein (putative c-di-GMP-specific phosphodiesterase class I)
MFDFFTLLVTTMVLLEAVGGMLLAAWWLQNRAPNALGWWGLAQGVAVLLVWFSWYTIGDSVARIAYADVVMLVLLLLGVLPAFWFLIVRLRRAEMELDSVRTRKNIWHFFAPDSRSPQTDTLDRDLRLALNEPDKQLSLSYQPIIDVASREVVGFEALLRWQHPQRGAISPAQFIPLAEKNGLILPLGLWVLEVACVTAAKWPSPWQLSVNVSPIQLQSDDLAANVRQVLERTKLAPERLELEVTEGVMIGATGRAVAQLVELRNMGVRVAIDDFGTGYSSLRYLEQLPCDTIKIDRSFVNDLESDPAARTITSAIVNLCRELGRDNVAEGVETEAQLSILHEFGCQRAQGFLLGRPMSPEDAVRTFGPKGSPVAALGRELDDTTVPPAAADTPSPAQSPQGGRYGSGLAALTP